MNQSFKYGIDHLTVGAALDIAAGKMQGVIDQQAISKINASHQYVKDIVAKKKTVYGINTGFGILANTPISEEDTATLQYKILQSHSVWVWVIRYRMKSPG